MHDELEALGGSLRPLAGAKITYHVYIGSQMVGSYWPQDSVWGSFSASANPPVVSYAETRAGSGTSNLQSERAAVDWILAQYFLQRSGVGRISKPSPAEPPEPPEFPTYVGWDGKEHEVF